MRKVDRRRCRKARKLRFEPLEYRLCLASVGWDGVGQGSASLTYYIGNVPSSFDLNQAQVDVTIEQSLAVWSDVVDVTFTETSVPNLNDSIDIEFYSIDGVGGTLAQAYLPDDVNPSRPAGDIVIDASERWELGNALGRAAFDLGWVMIHELGHSLGVEHVRSFGSVMYPSVSPNNSFSSLSSDDVDAVLALYAAADGVSGTTSEPPTDEESTDRDPTDEPPTEKPPTDEPPTDEPPTDEPPTDEPPTDEPPTDEPPTDAPPTDAPPTDEEPTDHDSADEEPLDEGPTNEEPAPSNNGRDTPARPGPAGSPGDRTGGGIDRSGRPTLTAYYSPYHNVGRAADVNGDNQVTAIDALQIINELNGRGARKLAPPEREGSSQNAMFDVNGDNQLSAIDALAVINELNNMTNDSDADSFVNSEELASADFGQSDGHHHHPGSHHDRCGHQNDERSNPFDRFDGNQDRVLTQDELPRRLGDRIAPANSAADSALTVEELEEFGCGAAERH